jgi:aryl-alcohol dehydrogenase-like predicted oxidoreductase
MMPPYGSKGHVPMEYRLLGQTGLSVSLICLGTMTWGQQNTQADAHAQISMALDHGINFMDTAEMYSVPISADTYGLTETYIGTWLAKNAAKRDQWILATKVAGPSGRLDWVRDGNLRLNRQHMTQALEDSLKRLQTDYVDLYQLHWPDRNANNFGTLGFEHDPHEDQTPLEETLDVLHDFVQQGKVRHIGVSNETPWGVMHALHLHKTTTQASRPLPRVQSVQNPYSLLNRSYEVGLAEVSLREQCGLLAYSPLAMGLLTGKYFEGGHGRLNWKPEYFTRYAGSLAEEAAQAYVAIARSAGYTPTQMALAFVNQQPFVTSIIIGATTLDQLKENMESVTVHLPADVLTQINDIHRKISNPCP